MANLKIRVFHGDEPEATITIPNSALKVARKLIPRKAAEAMQDKGVDLDEIIKLAENPEAMGELVQIEGHAKNERIIVSLE